MLEAYRDVLTKYSVLPVQQTNDATSEAPTPFIRGAYGIRLSKTGPVRASRGDAQSLSAQTRLRNYAQAVGVADADPRILSVSQRPTADDNAPSQEPAGTVPVEVKLRGRVWRLVLISVGCPLTISIRGRPSTSPASQDLSFDSFLHSVPRSSAPRCMPSIGTEYVPYIPAMPHPPSLVRSATPDEVVEFFSNPMELARPLAVGTEHWRANASITSRYR